ncbi:coiled-coil domain-containing protein 151 [Anableps anableps]
MLPKTPNLQLSLEEQKAELQRKIHLLEGEGTSFYERSQAAIKRNQEIIHYFRQETQKQYRELAEAKKQNASKKKSTTKLEQELMYQRRRLDALKHTTHTQQEHLDELKMEEERKNQMHSKGAVYAKTWDFENEEDARNFRALENRLDKFQFKCKEAEKCMLINLKLKAQMHDEFRNYGRQIDSLEAELLNFRQEFHNLQVQNKEAQCLKTTAEAELHQLEEQLSIDQKERESNKARLKQIIEQRKSQAERAEKKMQRTEMQSVELDSESQLNTSWNAAEEEKTISTFEEAFKSIKDATRVTDIQEVVENFNLEKENHQHLEKLKQENEKVLLKLKKEKELCSQQFEEIKYSGEAKLSSELKMLEECKQQLQVPQQRRDAAAERLASHVKTLSTIRAGVEHLAGKLKHISLTEDKASTVSSDSDEFVLELLTQCELKLQILQSKLTEKDLAAVMKEIEEDEFYTRIEGKLPKNNNKVQLPEEQAHVLSKEEGEIKEEEADSISREALKHQSQLILDSNLNKKPWKK